MVNAPLSSIALHERTRREIRQKSDLIPSMPEVVVEAIRLINDPSTELRQFEDCLRNDAALVARLLKIVNSPFYGTRNPVRTIRDGVGVLGMRSLRSLVLAAGTANYLERNYSCYGHDEKGLWQHSLAVAAGAKALSAHTGGSRQECEELFLAGLLHDIGKLLLGPYLTELGEDTTKHDEPGVEVEERLLGIEHQEAGALIADKWNLSPMVGAVIRNHHGPAPDEFRREIAVVRLADRRAHELGHGYRDDATSPDPVSDRAADLEAVALTHDKWDHACIEMNEAIEVAIASLGDLTS